MPDWLDELLSQIDLYAELNPNWDSYGAPKIDAAAIANAKVLLRLLAEWKCPRPAVTPTNREGVGFDWRCEDLGLDLELEVVPDGSGGCAIRGVCMEDE